MSYQIPPQNPSSPNNNLDSDQFYDYTNQIADSASIEQILSNTGFKRRTIPHQSPEQPGSAEKALNTEGNKSLMGEGSPRSADLIVNVSETPAFMGISYTGGDEGALSDLKFIINEAKKSEGRLFGNDDNFHYADNNIRIEEEYDIGLEYSEGNNRFGRIPTKVRKTSNQALEIDFTEDINYMEEINDDEKEPRTTGTTHNEGLNHSKSSYLSRPVRYSKMPEEEAATIFEQRRKELLGNLVKKERRKHLRIFQDADANTRVPTDMNATSTKGKSTNPGFVIFNTRNPSLNKPRLESPPPLKKFEDKGNLRNSSISTRNTKPRAGSSFANSEKRDLVNMPGPIKGNTLPKPKTAEQPNSQTLTQTQFKRPPSFRGTMIKSQKKEEVPNKIFVDRNTLKGNRPREKKSSMEDYIANEELKMMKRQTPFRSQETETAQEQQTDALRQSQLSQLPQLPQKNQNIWAEIENLDHQIQELQEDKTVAGNQETKKLSQSQNGWKKSKKEKEIINSLAKENRAEEPIEHINSHIKNQVSDPWTRNEERMDSYASERRVSDRYKLSGDDFLIEHETENVYARYQTKHDESNGLNNFYKSYTNEDIKDPLSQSERSFNEKQEPKRYELLYQRALEQKEARKTQYENKKKEKEMAELNECTFSPVFRARSIESSEDFNTRTKNWQAQKEKKLEEIERKKSQKEMEECTFHPQNLSRRTDLSKFDANEFYQRNLEWKLKIEAEEVRMQEEQLKLITSSSEKPKPQQRSTENSRIMKSQIITQPRISVKKSDTPLSGRSVAKKTAQEERKLIEKEKNKVLMQTQIVEGLIKKPFPHRSENHRTNPLEDDFLKRIELPKGQVDFSESTELFDLLRRVVTNKSEKSDGLKSKGTSQSPHRKSKNTTMVPFANKTNKQSEPVLSHTVTLNTVESNITIAKIKSPSAGDVPFILTEINPKELKSNAENIVIKNNKYYITKKLKSPTNQKTAFQQETASLDKKDDIPSLTYTLPSRIKNSKKDINGKQMRGFSPRRDQENNLSPKFFLDKQQRAQTPPDLFEDYPVEQELKSDRPPLASKQINGDFDSLKPHVAYGKQNENKEPNLTLEKKFLDLISQVSRVTQQLDQIRPSTTSQNDNLSSKRRRINFSLY